MKSWKLEERVHFRWNFVVSFICAFIALMLVASLDFLKIWIKHMPPPQPPPPHNERLCEYLGGLAINV